MGNSHLPCVHTLWVNTLASVYTVSMMFERVTQCECRKCFVNGGGMSEAKTKYAVSDSVNELIDCVFRLVLV